MFIAVYDRTGLIDETVGTLTEALQQELVITLVVIVLFLLHVRASIVVAVTMPLVGADVVHRHASCLASMPTSCRWPASPLPSAKSPTLESSSPRTSISTSWNGRRNRSRTKDREEVVIDATDEVASAVLTGVSTTIISFLPIFFLTGRDYKLFAPLAWTKTFAMIAAILVALFLVPLLCRLLLRSARWKRWLRRFRCGSLAAMGSFIAVAIGWDCGLDGHVADWALVEPQRIAAVVMGGIVWLLSRERLRPDRRESRPAD